MINRVRHAIVTVAVIVTAVTGAFVPTTAHSLTLDGADFNAGKIISNDEFFSENAMTARQIQSFLNRRVGRCGDTNTCLAEYSQRTQSREATSIHGDGVNPLCDRYDGERDETAAEIIFKVQEACHISAKVILATLQKEQGLITNANPGLDKLKIAMGYACPDTAPCDRKYYGFYNQVYSAASQFKRYTDPASTFWGSKPVGQVSPILYHPNTSCGTKDVHIRNAATHALYLYTPYTPNDAALRNLSGTGNACSSYGNSNFWEYFTYWFDAKANLKADVAELGSGVTDSWGELQDISSCTPTANVCYAEYQRAVAQWDIIDYLRIAEGRIASVYLDNGGLTGRLGAILKNVENVNAGARGNGHRQKFDGGFIYNDPENNATVVLNNVERYYNSEGGPAGSLGWPIADAQCDDGACSQDFQGGYVMTDPSGDFRVLTGEIADFLKNNGGIASPWGLPIADAQSVVTDGFGSGRSQRFENGTAFEHNGRAVFVTNEMLPSLTAVGGVVAVGWPRSPEQTDGDVTFQTVDGGRVVATGGSDGLLVPANLVRALRAAGGFSGYLGAPVSSATRYTGRDDFPGSKQAFEGGVIIRGARGAHPMPRVLWQRYKDVRGANGRYGWPTDKPSESSESWTQRFQHGRITVEK